MVESVRKLQNDRWAISWMIKQYELIWTNEKNLFLPVNLVKKVDKECTSRAETITVSRKQTGKK